MTSPCASHLTRNMYLSLQLIELKPRIQSKCLKMLNIEDVFYYLNIYANCTVNNFFLKPVYIISYLDTKTKHLF